MSKPGWRDVISRYQAATGLVHDREQFQSRHRQLRSQWRFCNKLRHSSGLGRTEDGHVDASDAWWKANTQVMCLYVFSGFSALTPFTNDIPNDVDCRGKLIC
jgi:hypothetical protein